jgi:hypothetical protein
MAPLAEGVSKTGLEYSVYSCPPNLHREVGSVLPMVPDLTKLLVIPTCQRAAMDLVQTGEDVEMEKDRLLEQVIIKQAC